MRLSAPDRLVHLVDEDEGGAVDFIEKPFAKDLLIGAIGEGFARIDESNRRHARADEALARLKAKGMR